MNVQNAKELTIEEGDVRTIHNSDGKQLWGKVVYSTTYTGDTTQATYSGKNLQPLFADGSISTSQTMTAGKLTLSQFYTGYNQTLTASNGILSTTSTGTSIWKMSFTGLTAETQYTISADFEIELNGTDKKFFALGNYKYNQPDTVSGRFSKTFTTDSSGEWISSSSTGDSLFYLYNNSSCTVSNIQLETGATATDYQEYVGGMPSPNPSYPQPINVVTGTQTIALSDGEVSEDYTVVLGTIELCKIGTYLDYIYTDGTDWYIHKAVGLNVLSSNDDWYYNSTSKGFSKPFVGDRLTTAYQGLCNYAVVQTNSNTWQGDGTCGWSGSNVFWFQDSGVIATSKADWQTWLTTHIVNVYYVLSTPTDTKITDTTLIGQLDAIHEWLTRYGYTATVAGNLPIVITKTNL